MKQLVCVAAGTCLAVSLVACGGGSAEPVTNAMPPAATAPGASWSYSVIHEFTDYPPSQLDGASPTGPLISDASGALYGTTQLGGSTGSCGTVFKLVPSGSGYTETILHSFPPVGTPPVCGVGADGWSPPWGVYMDAHGALYGTTEYGGAGCGSRGCGVVFKLTPSSSGYTETILHYFQGQPDGANPRSGVVADAQGALYGTTTVGGANNAGAVYKLKPSGSGYKESVIFSFGGSSGFGYYPNYGNLLLGKDGKVIYGTWQDNYYYGNGGVFALTLTKSRYAGRILYAFKGTPDGKGPWGTLVEGSRGIMYGVTAYGGTGSPYGCGSCGAVYSVTTTGKERVLYSFKGTSLDTRSPEDGANPAGGVIVGNTGTLYGMTINGGHHSCPSKYTENCGMVYELKKSGSKWKETVPYRFGSLHYWTDGMSPLGELIVDRSGALYGATRSGGYGSCLCGVVFKLVP